jgi:hypothetical protein
MIIGMRGYGRFLILASVLALAPVTVSGYGVGYDEALANNAGGNGKGKGQGATHAGSNNGGTGGGSVASAGGLAKGQSDPLHASKAGRINGVLKASSSAWQHASVNSPIGMIANSYALALSNYLNAAAAVTPDPNLVPPTLDEAAAILAKVANKDEISPELVEAIHQRLALESLVDPALLVSAPTTSDPAVQVQPTLAEQIALLATSLQAGETNQGLGPIY